MNKVINKIILKKKDLKKFLNSLNLKYVKIKAPNQGRFAFITFQDEAARDEALKLLNGAKYKSRELEAFVREMIKT